jgi:diguanylate cyclase (GGDEF)-like protein
MRRLPSRLWSWPVWAGLAWCVLAPASHAAATITDPGQFLDRIESLRTADHQRFEQMLAQIHRESPRLTTAEQWHLRYLDAYETLYQGDVVKSEPQLREIIDHSGDATLVAKASALLLDNLGLSRRYEEAFELANHLTATLPDVKDPQARVLLLSDLSQMLDLAGQIDLAIQYARMAEEAVPPGETVCRPLYMEVAALSNGKRLASTSTILQRAIDTCVAARQPVVTETIWLVLGSIYIDENQPAKALAIFDRIDPDIRANHYYLHMLSAQVERAQAYEKLGRDDEANKAAVAAVAMSHPGDISEWLQTAYELLYRIEKKRGNAAAALGYYEQYVVQDKAYLNDISARTLAYQTVQQHVLARKLETEELGKQNNILRLQQALDTKAVETSRLYIILLLMSLAFIVLWLYRLKRSQLGFKRLSHHDGLTGIFNHQHFISEAGRVLRLMEKKLGHACLISIDLDHFKQVNDTHGHVMGDAVLKHAVAICQQHLRPADLFGRLGGEEFGILLHECCRNQGMDIANRIRIAIEASPMEKDGCVISISTSVGLASTDTSGYELLRLCTEADAALYRAKRAGRNRVIADTESDGLVEA